MNRAELERLQAIVDALAVPVPWSLSTFVAALSAQRGRPIQLHPLEGPTTADTPTGLWVPSREADYIFTRQQRPCRTKSTSSATNSGTWFCGINRPRNSPGVTFTADYFTRWPPNSLKSRGPAPATGTPRNRKLKRSRP